MDYRNILPEDALNHFDDFRNIKDIDKNSVFKIEQLLDYSFELVDKIKDANSAEAVVGFMEEMRKTVENMSEWIRLAIKTSDMNNPDNFLIVDNVRKVIVIPFMNAAAFSNNCKEEISKAADDRDRKRKEAEDKSSDFFKEFDKLNLEHKDVLEENKKLKEDKKSLENDLENNKHFFSKTGYAIIGVGLLGAGVGIGYYLGKNNNN